MSTPIFCPLVVEVALPSAATSASFMSVGGCLGDVLRRLVGEVVAAIHHSPPAAPRLRPGRRRSSSSSTLSRSSSPVPSARCSSGDGPSHHGRRAARRRSVQPGPARVPAYSWRHGDPGGPARGPAGGVGRRRGGVRARRRAAAARQPGPPVSPGRRRSATVAAARRPDRRRLAPASPARRRHARPPRLRVVRHRAAHPEPRATTAPARSPSSRWRAAQDVATAFAFAQDHGVPVAIRSGGHSYPGLVGRRRRARRRRPAARPRLAERHDGAPSAPAPRSSRCTTGWARAAAGSRAAPARPSAIAGLTQGGGVGVLTRAHGLTCDAVTSMQVVLADGRVVTASADQEPDLFWALRGGGGGHLGVVTSFTFKTFAAPTITRAYVAVAVLRGTPRSSRSWLRTVAAAPTGGSGRRSSCSAAQTHPSGPALFMSATWTGPASRDRRAPCGRFLSRCRARPPTPAAPRATSTRCSPTPAAPRSRSASATPGRAAR